MLPSEATADDAADADAAPETTTQKATDKGLPWYRLSPNSNGERGLNFLLNQVLTRSKEPAKLGK
jgi:hypothetical protein